MEANPKCQAPEATASDPNGKSDQVSAKAETFVDPSVAEADRAVAADLAWLQALDARESAAQNEAVADSFRHSQPMPLPRALLTTEREEGYRLGCRDTARAVRLGIAQDLERQGEIMMRIAAEQEPGQKPRAVSEGVATELFVQAARIRQAVTL